MEINVHDSTKSVDIWLTRAEQQDPAVKQQVDELCARYKPRKYMVAVFCSGGRELYDQTRDLLIYNRRRQAELEVRREKAAQPAAGACMMEENTD